ncbi:MAG TPA: hypothetical protein VEH31_02880 [Streptosporangiaceae bacterium]|nr:hypothetical protein [Streptosporangiaceae bacterium]
MIESQLRTLFAQIASGEPARSRVDTQLARRAGRARLRRRRTWVAGGSVLAAAAVAALAVGVGPARPGPGPAATGPAAPRQFSPLVPYASFGWLPPGVSLYAGGITPAETYMDAGRVGPDWALGVYARGQCHLTGSASVLNCPGSKLRIRQRAPDVAGHRAFWTGPGPGIVWQYARGGWAAMTIPAPNLSAVLHSKQDLAGTALKIARGVRYGVTTRLVFPARFSGLPRQWQVHNISFYVPDGGLLRADQYMLTTGGSRLHPRVGDTGIWTGAPYIIVGPALRKSTCTPHDPGTKNTSEIINGYRVVLKRFSIGGRPVQELCGAHADGLAFDIQVFGAHTGIDVASLFRDHMRLLGTNPADWTTNPIG